LSPKSSHYYSGGRKDEEGEDKDNKKGTGPRRKEKAREGKREVSRKPDKPKKVKSGQVDGVFQIS
jgi:hypothetical protein